MDDLHIQKVISLPLVNKNLIKEAKLRVAIDCVNSVGGLIIPKLLKALGVENILEIYCEPNGHFPHNPEPLPENLHDISEAVIKNKADVGFVVDPDVDRLAIICEDGTMFGEEYTLVAVADYILENTPGPTCSNLSSSRALSMITQRHGQQYFSAAVGEVNVVEKMKEEKCVIGGEGNGGIIYPEIHFGRDALVGIALFLTHLANKAVKCSELRDEYPRLEMIKNKITLEESTNIDHVLSVLEKVFSQEKTDLRDGLKIDFEDGWVHLRKSNTEPIIRIYAEAPDQLEAENLVNLIMTEFKKI